MSRAVPRPLVGLAATALAAGLLGAPLASYADPTPTPSPSATAAGRTATPTPSPSSASSSTSASPSPTGTPGSASATPSADPSETPSVDPSEATPSPSSTTSAGRVGADAVQAPAPTASESSTDQVQAQAVAGAAISLTKTASPTRVSKVGQVITYRFVASNAGSIVLDDVAIADDLDGLSPLDCTGSTTLAAGTGRLTCTATLTVTQDWIDFGSVDNSATVFGSYPIEEGGGTDYVGANASAHVSVDQKPAIALDASVSPTGTADAGDRLRYEATATNTGNVTLRGARITSSLDRLDLDCDPSARATLAPGESMTCNGSYKVTTSDGRRGKLSNKLTASATGPYDDQGVDDTVTLRTKVTKITSSSDSDPGLADTGGPGDALPVGLLGLTALAAGGWLVRRGRRA